MKARGAEVGLRTKAIDGLDSTLTFWGLNFNSENQFDGDTGTTLFGRPSRRYGIELANHYSPYDWLHFDGDLTLSHARSRGFDTPAARGMGATRPAGDDRIFDVPRQRAGQLHSRGRRRLSPNWWLKSARRRVGSAR